MISSLYWLTIWPAILFSFNFACFLISHFSVSLFHQYTSCVLHCFAISKGPCLLPIMECGLKREAKSKMTIFLLISVNCEKWHSCNASLCGPANDASSTRQNKSPIITWTKRHPILLQYLESSCTAGNGFWCIVIQMMTSLVLLQIYVKWSVRMPTSSSEACRA